MLRNSVPCKRQLEWISYRKTWSGNQNVCLSPYFLSISFSVLLHVALCFSHFIRIFSHCSAECSLSIFKPERMKEFSLEFLECIVVMRNPSDEGLLFVLCIGHCVGGRAAFLPALDRSLFCNWVLTSDAVCPSLKSFCISCPFYHLFCTSSCGVGSGRWNQRHAYFITE